MGSDSKTMRGLGAQRTRLQSPSKIPLFCQRSNHLLVVFCRGERMRRKNPPNKQTKIPSKNLKPPQISLFWEGRKCLINHLKRRKDGDCTSEWESSLSAAIKYQIFYTRFCFLGLGKGEIDKPTAFGFAYGCTQPGSAAEYLQDKIFHN